MSRQIIVGYFGYRVIRLSSCMYAEQLIIAKSCFYSVNLWVRKRCKLLIILTIYSTVTLGVAGSSSVCSGIFIVPAPVILVTDRSAPAAEADFPAGLAPFLSVRFIHS